MRFKILLSIIVTALISPYVGLAQDLNYDKPLTLEECVQFALVNNHNLRSARLEEAIAETQVGETRSIGLPQVNFQSNLNYNYAVRQAFLPETFIDPNGDPENSVPAPFGVNYDADAIISASQLLFDGSYFVGLQAAKTLRDLRKRESNRTEIETVEAISKAYYLVLINQERLDLIEVNKSQLEKVAKETEALAETGFTESIDLDRINVNLNNLNTELKRIERSLNASNDLLKFQMGIPIDEKLKLSGSLEQIDFDAADYLNSEVNFDVNDRVDYAILNVNEELTQLDLKNNQATLLPKLYANFSYGYNTGTNRFSDLSRFSDRWLDFGVLGVSFQWDLFTGFNRNNKMQKNRIQLQQLDIQKDMLKNSIDLEIKQSKDGLKSSAEQLDIQKQNIDLAQKVYDQTQIKYKNGVGSSRDLLDAETSLKEAQTNYFNALYEAIISKIELEKALGILY